MLPGPGQWLSECSGVCVSVQASQEGLAYIGPKFRRFWYNSNSTAEMAEWSKALDLSLIHPDLKLFKFS